jgi:hypothetical protein
MRCNAINMLRQAVQAIDPERDDFGYAYMLGEFSSHLAHVRNGEISWEEFAEFYCLTARDRPQPPVKRELSRWPADVLVPLRRIAA